MDNKIRIIHVLSSDIYSGAENVVCQIMNMFQGSEEYQMFYCSLDGPVRDSLAERGIDFLPIKNVSVSEIRRVIRNVKPDVIHAHDMRASFFVAKACGKIPLISHIHNNSFDSRKISIKSVLYLYAVSKAKHIFWVSQSAMNGYRFQNWFQKKSSVLHNVINIAQLKEKVKEDPNEYPYDIVYIGGLKYPKNTMRLIRVLKIVVQTDSTIKAALIGEGDEAEQVKQYISDNNIQNNVKLLGFLKNPYKILSDAKCMVMTSLWEGLPMCALEAMALGVPIVSTPTDGLCELVIDSETGFLTDDDNQLAQYILQIINEKSVHKRMSALSSQRAVALMNIEKYRETLNTTYHEALRRC